MRKITPTVSSYDDNKRENNPDHWQKKIATFIKTQVDTKSSFFLITTTSMEIAHCITH